MARPLGAKTVYFSRVKEAREAMREKAVELFETQQKIIKEALAAEDFEVAANANQWLLEHLPADDEGTRVIDISVDKPKQLEQKSGPTVQIGFSLGGMPAPKSLPEPVTIESEAVEVETETEESESVDG